jgi:hypothetical protein
MRMSLLTAFALAAVSAATTFGFSPDKLNKITFENTTGTRIEMIFLSPRDSKFWGPDLLGADYILEEGKNTNCYLDYPAESFGFDVMATDDKGNKFEIRDFEVTDGNEATVSLTSKSLKTRAPDFSLATVRAVNSTGHEIQYLFVPPGDSAAWGADLLVEETTLADGDSYSFLLAVGKNKMKYKVMGVDENGDEYQFTVTIDPRVTKEFTWTIEPGDLTKAK